MKEAEKALQRAKRFGTGGSVETNTSVGVKGLDEALPDERSHKRSRNDQGGRGGKRRDTGRHRNNRGGGRHGGGNRAPRNQNEPARPQKSWNEKDALAMEARKKRFAAAA